MEAYSPQGKQELNSKNDSGSPVGSLQSPGETGTQQEAAAFFQARKPTVPRGNRNSTPDNAHGGPPEAYSPQGKQELNPKVPITTVA